MCEQCALLKQEIRILNETNTLALEQNILLETRMNELPQLYSSRLEDEIKQTKTTLNNVLETNLKESATAYMKKYDKLTTYCNDIEYKYNTLVEKCKSFEQKFKCTAAELDIVKRESKHLEEQIRALTEAVAMEKQRRKAKEAELVDSVEQQNALTMELKTLTKNTVQLSNKLESALGKWNEDKHALVMLEKARVTLEEQLRAQEAIEKQLKGNLDTQVMRTHHFSIQLDEAKSKVKELERTNDLLERSVRNWKLKYDIITKKQH